MANNLIDFDFNLLSLIEDNNQTDFIFTFDYNPLTIIDDETFNNIDENFLLNEDEADDKINETEESDKEISDNNKDVTPCVILDNNNDRNKIERCNHYDKRNYSIHNLIGCFEI